MDSLLPWLLHIIHTSGFINTCLLQHMQWLLLPAHTSRAYKPLGGLVVVTKSL